MLIYIHVPFCVSRCDYCAFHSIAVGKNNPAPIQDYIDTLMMEIALAGERNAGKTVRSVFFGGGTPSLLPPAAINVIMSRLAKAFKFSQRPEITLEANPETLKRKNIFQDFLAAGINRLSIGAQALDDAALKSLGRIHKARDVFNAIMGAAAAGFTNIGLDLMWGLPGQSIRQWLQTLKEATQTGASHISAYNLSLEPGTPLEKKWEAGELALPPERDQALMFMEGSSLLESAGFLQYEISNFAKMGFQCRHNMGYWEGADYLGLGPSSTSTLGQFRWTNPASIPAWKSLIEKRESGHAPEILTPATRILETVMLRLRTARGLRLKAYRDLTGRDFIKEHQKMIQAMHDNGLVKIRNGYLSLTRAGMLVSNTIIGNLFESIKDSLDNPASFQKTTPEKPGLAEDCPPRPVIWPLAEQAGKSRD